MQTSFILTNEYANIRLEFTDVITGKAINSAIDWTSNVLISIYFTNTRSVTSGYDARFNVNWDLNFNGVNYTGTAANVSSKSNEKLVKTYSVSIERGTGWNSDYISSVPFTFSATVSPGDTSVNASWPTVTLTENSTAALDRKPEAATITSRTYRFNQHQNPQITYRMPNPAVVSDIRLELHAGNAVIARDGLLIEEGSLTYTMELTESEVNIICSEFTITQENTITFVLHTTIEDTTYQPTGVPAYFIITGTEDALPKVTTSYIEDTNSATVAATGNKRCLVRYKSNARCVITYQCAYGAFINRITVDNGEQGAALDFNNGASSGTDSLTIQGISKWPVKATLTDSRGFSNTVTIGTTTTFDEYVSPTCVFDVHMSPDGIATLSLKGAIYLGTFNSGAVQNYLSLQYRYLHQAGTNQYTDWINIVSPNIAYENNSYNLNFQVEGFNYKDSYTFQARVSDLIYFSSSDYIESIERTITAMPVFDWSKRDFNFNVPINVNGDYYQNNELVNLPQMGTWEPQCNAIATPLSYGNYLRIGDMCFISFYLEGIVTANPADVDFKLNIYGLPFTPDINQRWYAGGGNCQGYAVPAKGNSTGSPITYTPPSGAKTDHRFVGWSIEGGVIYGRTQCGFSSDDTAEYEYASNNHSDVTLRKNYNYLKPEGSFYITALPGQQFYASGTILYKLDPEQGGIVG